MEPWLIILLVLLTLHPVSFVVLGIVAGFPYKKRIPGKLPTLTVIIKARNEEKKIATCLDSIAKAREQFPFKVILVDDGSQDETRRVMTEHPAANDAVLIAIHHPWTEPATRERDNIFALNNPGFFVYNAESYLPGLQSRQRGIAASLEHVTTEVVLLTDGDCTVSANWASSAQQMLGNYSLVCGYVNFAPGPRQLFDRIVAVEAMLLQAASAAAFRLGKPGGAMGANLSYRISAYQAVGGYPGLGSSQTEDAQVAIAVSEKLPVAYNTDPKAVVDHRSRLNPRQFIRQRAFWLVGGAEVSLLWIVIPWVLALDAIAPWVALGFAWGYLLPWEVVVWGFAGRLLGDGACWLACRKLDDQIRPWDLLLAWPFQAFYLLILPFLTMAGMVRVIGRKTRREREESFTND